MEHQQKKISLNKKGSYNLPSKRLFQDEYLARYFQKRTSPVSNVGLKANEMNKTREYVKQQSRIITVTFILQICSDNQMKENEMEGTVPCMEQIRYIYRILIDKSGRKKRLGRSRHIRVLKK
jgi:hypothetical protein